MKPFYLIALVALAWVLGAGCGMTDDGGTDSNTNFQFLCSSGDDCVSDLSCLCGICTRPCDTEASCSALADGAECVSLGSESREQCGLGPDAAICTTRCSSSVECGASLECLDGACVAPEAGTVSDAGMMLDAAPPRDDSGQPSEDRCEQPEFYTCSEPYLGVNCPENPEGQGPTVDCGLHVGSLYDENGCELPACTTDADCSDGEVCVGPGGPRAPCNSAGSFSCRGSQTCSCTNAMDCVKGSACLPREAVPEEFLDLNCREGREGLPYGDCTGARSDLDRATALFNEGLESYTQAERRWLGECAAGATVTLSQDAPCSGSVDTCELLCELHPCTEMTACIEQCRAFTEGEVISMLEQAARRTPGMCSCDICVDVPFTACAEIWQCQQG